MPTIRGNIKKILTQTDSDWGRYEVETTLGSKLLCVGVIPEASIGMNVALDGYEETNQYGHQFKVKNVLKAEADEFAGVRRFLAGGFVKYIGSAKAESIISLYGNKSLDLFDTPEGRKALTKAKGITSNIIEKALPSYEENKKYKGIITFLNGSGTPNQVAKIYDMYGERAVPVLKANPYRLQMDIDGFGFLKADKIALGSGIKPDSELRVMAGIKYAIEDAAQKRGDCYLTVKEIRDTVDTLLAPTPKIAENISAKIIENAIAEWDKKKEDLITKYDPSYESIQTIAQVVETRKLIRDNIASALEAAIDEGTLVNLDGRIYTKKMYETERYVADTLLEMTEKHPVRFVKTETIQKAIEDVEKRKSAEIKKAGGSYLFTVTDEQKEAIFLGAMHRVSIISGGPGRGKTAISEIVAESFLRSGRAYRKSDVIMLAPTGRAAQRIMESTGYDAMTAHRAVLKASKDNDYPKGKLILCDETSMVDIHLMKKILKFGKDCNLIFVGDVDQIASVGPGKVLKDMIDSGTIPCILLKEGHRNTGSIAKNAALINAGCGLRDYTYDSHFHYEGFNTDEVYGTSSVEELFNKMVKDYVEKVKQYGIKEVMLCTAKREIGTVCVTHFNKVLQDVFTKGRPEANFGSGRIFRIGDRVMQTKNDYSFVKLVGKEKIPGVFNGEKGTVVKILPDYENDSQKLVVLFDDGSIGGYLKSGAENLTLAYATTLHKCQGSEAKCMMMAYTYGDYILLNRSLFYTGETRAKEEFRFYGEERKRGYSAFDMAVSSANDAHRNTSLSEMLQGVA